MTLSPTAQMRLMNSIPEFTRAAESSGLRCAEAGGAGADVIVWVPAARSAGRVCGPLSIRAVWGGSETCTIGRRALRIDEDNYLVVNGGREYLVRADGGSAPESLTIFFSEEAQRSHGLLARGVPAGASSLASETHQVFAEHLRPHGDAISQFLQRIRDARCRGVTDNAWYSKQVRMLYAQLVVSEEELHGRSSIFAPASLCTRAELFRRVMTATDYINSNFMSSITLDDIAGAALLSKFHLARLFRAFHGASPAAYLRAKRIRTAERLIERSDVDLAEVAERCGFGSRWSMFRALRRRRGMSGQRLRQSSVRSMVTTLRAV